jgi:serine/threonine-protein kinase RsbT
MSTIRVPINSAADILTARQSGRSLARQIGFSSPTDLTLIATAISELARNIVHYAKHGEVVLDKIQQNGKCGITIIAKDEGPGIADIAQAMRAGYSTSGGLGLGLPGVQRLMDQFDITSTSLTGTTITAIKWVQRNE